MKKKLGAILLVVALVLALALPAAPAAAHVEGAPFTVVLVADGGSAATKVDVGTVSVWNDSEELHVKYETTDGWVMTATHLEVALTEPAIPQNRKGNPKVGHFSRNEPHDPPVTEWEEVFNLDGESWPPCTDLVIAAQADVQKLSDVITATLVTGAGTDNVVVIAEDPLNLGYPVVPPYGTPSPAVPTWVHPSWPSIAGAAWISSAYYVENPPPNSWRLFTRSFSVPSNAVNLSGTLQITSDNAEDVKLNGTPVGIDGEVYGPFIDNHEWATVLPRAVSPQPGSNTLEVMVRNYAGSSSPTGNPTGLIYKMEYEYQLLRTETAWGGWYDGERFTSRGNWATHFEYHVQVELATYGTATAKWTDDEAHSGDYSWELYVPDGTADMAAVVFDVDIALEDITTLSFWKMVTAYDTNGWNPSVILLIDADGDGLEFGIDDAMEWHFTWSGSLLDDDAFVELESPTGLSSTEVTWTQLDALAMSAWGADASGFLYGTGGYNAGLAGFQSGGPYGVIDPTDKVLMVAIVIGGAGSWMDETAYIDDVVIAGP